MQGSIANSQSLNKYAYVQGNPVKYTDPFGLCPFMNFRDIGHGVLSLLGMVPGAVGVVADAVNVVWYAVEGNGKKAVECAMSALPGIGDIGAKFLNAKNLVQTAQFVQSISHVVGNAYAFANTFKEASNNAANIYNSLKTGNADWGYVVGQAGAFALNVLTASLAAKDVAENMSTLKNMMSQSVKNVTKLASGQTCEGNGNCFVAGTLIVTSDGTKEIEDIEAGDYVLAKNTHTGEQEYREVTNVFVRETDTLVLVTLEETIIETTETHPFYTEEGWKCAADLKAGDRLELADGTYAEVTVVEVVKLDEAGVNVITAVKILSEIGDIKRLANANKLAQFAGIAPLHLSSSGKGKEVATKQGNRRLQATIYFLAIQMVQVSSKGTSRNPVVKK